MFVRYGDRELLLSLPRTIHATLLKADVAEPAASPEEMVRAALDSCGGMLSRFRPGEKVVVVASDVTRHTGSEVFLPLLADRLNAAGIPDDDITVLIALGIHRKQTEAEHRRILGPLYGRVRVIDHECDDPGKLVEIGRTSSGIPVEINRTAAEADRLILTGTVGFHYFAGFGGGRKSVLPGIASRRACMASHFMVLNPGEGTGKNALAATGNLEGNPVHRAMAEACALAAPDFILNTVVSPDKKILAAFAGDWREAHADGCRFYADNFCAPIREKADLVVISCGGYPKDINLIQAHKSMEYGSHALRDGGVMILLAQCRDGYGNATFFDWFQFPDLEAFEAELRRRYEINDQTAYSVLQKARRFRVILVSDLHPEEVRTMGMIPAQDLDAAVALAEGMLPPEATAYVLPEGGTVLPVVCP